jgi:hypothetical protein
MVNITKSGSQDSSFTKAAMVSLKHGESSTVTSDSRLDDDDLDDQRLMSLEWKVVAGAVLLTAYV